MPSDKDAQDGEFWWLRDPRDRERLTINVGHSLPTPVEGTPSIPWHSLSPGGELSEVVKDYALSFRDIWTNACRNENVFRSLVVKSTRQSVSSMIGPFVVDIDGDEELDDTTRWASAASLTVAVVDALSSCGVSRDDFRILSTGHKGYCVEVRPESIGLSSLYEDGLGPRWRKRLSELAGRCG